MSPWWLLPTMVLIAGAGVLAVAVRALEAETRRLGLSVARVQEARTRNAELAGAVDRTRLRLEQTTESVARRNPR